MRNGKAIGALACASVAIALLVAAVLVPRYVDTIDPLRALFIVPLAVVFALAAISLARRARFDFQQTLGRIGGDGLAVLARILGVTALLVSLTAALAVGVFAVLDLWLA